MKSWIKFAATPRLSLVKANISALYHIKIDCFVPVLYQSDPCKFSYPLNFSSSQSEASTKPQPQSWNYHPVVGHTLALGQQGPAEVIIFQVCDEMALLVKENNVW